MPTWRRIGIRLLKGRGLGRDWVPEVLWLLLVNRQMYVSRSPSFYLASSENDTPPPSSPLGSYAPSRISFKPNEKPPRRSTLFVTLPHATFSHARSSSAFHSPSSTSLFFCLFAHILERGCFRSHDPLDTLHLRPCFGLGRKGILDTSEGERFSTSNNGKCVFGRGGRGGMEDTMRDSLLESLGWHAGG